MSTQDAFLDNVLLSFAGGPIESDLIETVPRPRPLRSLFPCRYYLIDFELAVIFEHSSESSSRVVTGLPTKGQRSGEYGRDIAPELETDEPYCPFKLDMWQIGSEFRKYFMVRSLRCCRR